MLARLVQPPDPLGKQLDSLAWSAARRNAAWTIASALAAATAIVPGVATVRYFSDSDATPTQVPLAASIAVLVVGIVSAGWFLSIDRRRARRQLPGHLDRSFGELVLGLRAAEDLAATPPIDEVARALAERSRVSAESALTAQSRADVLRVVRRHWLRRAAIFLSAIASLLLGVTLAHTGLRSSLEITLAPASLSSPRNAVEVNTVRHPAVLRDAVLQIVPPAYSGSPTTVIPVSPGDENRSRILQGSSVSLLALVDPPPLSASGGATISGRQVTLHADAASPGRDLLETRIETGGTESLHVRAEFEVMPDQPPSVRLDSASTTDSDHPADQPLRMELLAADDIGIAGAQLAWMLQTPDGRCESGERALPGHSGAKQLRDAVTFDPVSAGVPPGSILVFWASVSDGRPMDHGGPQSARTTSLEVCIGDPQHPGSVAALNDAGGAMSADSPTAGNATPTDTGGTLPTTDPSSSPTVANSVSDPPISVAPSQATPPASTPPESPDPPTNAVAGSGDLISKIDHAITTSAGPDGVEPHPRGSGGEAFTLALPEAAQRRAIAASRSLSSRQREIALRYFELIAPPPSRSVPPDAARR